MTIWREYSDELRQRSHGLLDTTAAQVAMNGYHKYTFRRLDTAKAFQKLMSMFALTVLRKICFVILISSTYTTATTTKKSVWTFQFYLMSFNYST
jgi:hypothetical protein